MSKYNLGEFRGYKIREYIGRDNLTINTLTLKIRRCYSEEGLNALTPDDYLAMFYYVHMCARIVETPKNGFRFSNSGDDDKTVYDTYLSILEEPKHARLWTGLVGVLESMGKFQGDDELEPPNEENEKKD